MSNIKKKNRTGSNSSPHSRFDIVLCGTPFQKIYLLSTGRVKSYSYKVLYEAEGVRKIRVRVCTTQNTRLDESDVRVQLREGVSMRAVYTLTSPSPFLTALIYRRTINELCGDFQIVWTENENYKRSSFQSLCLRGLNTSGLATSFVKCT